MFQVVNLAPNAPPVENANFTNGPTGTYTFGADSYKYVKFTGSSGTLTVTVEGIADILAVGPGQTTSGLGNGGVVAYSSIIIPVGSYQVAIGASETSQGAGNSSPTRLGNVIGAGRGIGSSNLGNGGFNPSSNGVVIDITGTSREYGAGGGRKASLPNPEDQYGIGGDSAISNRAGSGVVIVRVRTN